MSRDSLRIETFAGDAMRPHIPALAGLRMSVFRDFPYLYDGDEAYEATYLADYIAAPSAALVVAFDGTRPVGCSTCVRLAEEDDALRAPFEAAGIDAARVFYFGESVLLPEYRGQGAGVAFFAAREAHARAVSTCDLAAFCAVRRPEDHPLRPQNAASLEPFWRKRGFTPTPNLVAHLTWKQIDTGTEVENTLAFWLKPLRGGILP